jgi:hypothetical protein
MRAAKVEDQSFFARQHAHARNDRDEGCRSQNEVAARDVVELCSGRSLTDAEWLAARAKLSEFVGILSVWDRKTPASRRGNVEGLCQREP